MENVLSTIQQGTRHGARKGTLQDAQQMKRSRGRPHTKSILLKAPHRPSSDARAGNGKVAKGQISATLFHWAENLGIDSTTLKRRLNEQSINYEPSSLSAQQVFKAMYGDKEAAMTKKLLAESAKVERENRVADGELLEMPVIEKKLWVDLLSPLRLALEQMPEQMAGMCNPESPDVAKGVLRRFVEDLKLKLKGSEK